MKKMIFGILLFAFSVAILLTLFVLSFHYPAIYNDRAGFLGFLLAHKYLVPAVILIIIGIFGISLCALEAFNEE